MENANPKKIRQYLQEAREELKKVTWPTKKQVVNHSLLVIAISVAAALFLAMLDLLFSQGIQLLITRS